MTKVKIGVKIKRLREKRGLTQKELSRKARMDLSAIGKIEAGMRSPTLETRKKLAKALAVNITELLD